MGRDSCIVHKPKQIMSVVRQDYYLLMQKDTTAAAMLSVFEYWANGEISRNPDAVDPNLGVRSIKEIEEMLLGVATDKQIRLRLKALEDRGYIETKQEKLKGSIKQIAYRFMVSKIQSDLDGLDWQIALNASRCLAIPQSNKRRSNNRRDGGQITDDERRSNNRRDGGQITDVRRSNNRRDGGQITEQLYIRKNDLEIDQKEEEKAPPLPLPQVAASNSTQPTQNPETLEAEIVEDGHAHARSHNGGNPRKRLAQNEVSYDLPSFVESDDNVYSLVVKSSSQGSNDGDALKNENHSIEAKINDNENHSNNAETNALLEEIHKLANKPQKLSWMSSAATFRDEMIQAVYDGNSEWYSLPKNKGINRTQIVNHLKRLMKDAKSINAETAIAAWDELNNHWKTAITQTPEAQAAKQHFKQKDTEARASRRQQIENNLSELLK